MGVNKILLDVLDVVVAGHKVQREFFILILEFSLFFLLFAQRILLSAHTGVAFVDFIVQVAHVLYAFAAAFFNQCQSILDFVNLLVKFFLTFLLRVQFVLGLAQGVLFAGERATENIGLLLCGINLCAHGAFVYAQF